MFYIKILLNDDWEDIHMANEVSYVFITIESSLQSIFTLWLILRGIIRSPLNYDNIEVISWTHDKFGNPIPLPTIPLASVLSSLLSLLIVSIRLQFKDSFWEHIKNLNIDEALARVLWVIFSVFLRICAITFLCIYFDTKTILFLLTILVVNFSVSYKLEFSGQKKISSRPFSLWLTSFFNIFVPCWFYRQSSPQGGNFDSDVLRKMSTVAVPGNILILLWLVICFLLVNFTQFRYNNNLLDNDDFILGCISLIIFVSINISITLINLKPNWPCFSSRHLLTILTSLFTFIAAVALIILYSSAKESRSLDIVAHHYYQESNNAPQIFLKSYRVQILKMPKHSKFSGVIVQCSDLNTTNEEGTSKILLFDPTDSRCGHANTSLVSGVLILEDWQFKSSSPYPDKHKYLDASLLVESLSASVLSLRKLPSHEMNRFLDMRTFISSLDGEGSTSLASYTKNHLTVDCGNYSCVNVHSEQSVHLNNLSQPSMNVQLTLEEVTYRHNGLYRISSLSSEQQYANVACSGQLTLDLDTVFCDYDGPQFWHTQYLDNYMCCHGVASVLTSDKCALGTASLPHGHMRTLPWSAWSTWSRCDTLVTGSGLDNVTTRYKLSGRKECLAVMLESKRCEDNIYTGGCSLQSIRDIIPNC